jgi:hypothetical protein
MAKPAPDKLRLIRITEGNLRNHLIYISEHYDFFPHGCFRVPRRHQTDSRHPLRAYSTARGN